ncbi:MAG: glycosyltransferase family 2 protein [Candidatus Aminicenantes bacterium]|nr:MAG: glycosyltransferase family 2 protein [Candidatus Aminicenantes bacterium]
MKVLVLIPAYNEEKTIRSVVEETQHYLPEADILVLNDGSTDNTKAALSQYEGIIVLHHPYNMGIGGAIWTGFNFFVKNNYEYLVRVDGDGQHPPSLAKMLLEPLQNGEADLVIGSRFIKREGYLSSLGRRGGIKLLNILTTFLLKEKITDNTSGFRAYNRRAACLLVEDYPFDYPEPIEVYLLDRKGLKIRELSVKMRERKGGVTSISLLHSYYYLIKVLLTILVNFFFGGKK